ncbi:MAG: hypothetical protein MJY99_01050 [Fibrobacter sp.]|nr:hypothetical protein [Fibrobacter sp.]
MLKKCFCSLVVSIAVMASLSFAEDEDPCSLWPDLKTETIDEEVFYKIGSADDLYKFACMVNNSERGVRFNAKLTEDICLNACGEGDKPLLEQIAGLESDENPAVLGFTQWTPIGVASYSRSVQDLGVPYFGIFDGDNHVIRGIYFNDTLINEVGLFTWMALSEFPTTVKNLGIVDSYIRGRSYVGSVAGDGGIAEFVNVYNTGTVIGGFYVGGITGSNGSIFNSHNAGKVVATSDEVGGIMGFTNDLASVGKTLQIQGSYNVGDVFAVQKGKAGGIVGSFTGTVSNCYNAGTIHVGPTNHKAPAGGIVGVNKGSILNSYNTGNIEYLYGRASGGVVLSDGSIAILPASTTPDVVTLYIGGIAGESSGEIENSYSVGGVVANMKIEGHGGLVGSLDTKGSIASSYYSKDFFAAKSVGSGRGDDNFELHVDEFAGPELLSGFEEDVWIPGSELYLSDGNLMIKLPGLKYFGIQPEVTLLELKKDAEDNEFYEISSPSDLRFFSLIVRNFNSSANGKLTSNICLNACGENDATVPEQIADLEDDEDVSSLGFEQFLQIGTAEKQYSGTFDGNGFLIRGLYFNKDEDYVGLFGYVNNATIKNVGVGDSYIKGANYVGGVVGHAASGTISDVYNTGSVIGTGDFVGGVVGKNGASVNCVYHSGLVDAVGENVGGVAGGNSGSVSYAYFNKDIPCEKCNSVGAGKEAVYLTRALPPGFDETVWTVGSSEPFAIKGELFDELIGLKNVDSYTLLRFTGFMPKPDAEGTMYYEIATTQELTWFSQLVNTGNFGINGKLTADICFNSCADGDTPVPDQILDIAITKDFSAYGFTSWTPIGGREWYNEGSTFRNEGKYSGIFDGDGHTIRGLFAYIKIKPEDAALSEDDYYMGLFGYVKNATIKNVGVVDSYVQGDFCIGGVVGSAVSSTISNVYYTGKVSGENNVGGVVGVNYNGTVENASFNKGELKGAYAGGVVGINDRNGIVRNVYNAAYIHGSGIVGGVVGENISGTVSNAYNIGLVEGSKNVGGVVGYNSYFSTVNNVYNTGSVNQTNDGCGGGVIGENEGGALRNAYNTGDVSCVGAAGGVLGCSAQDARGEKIPVVESVYNTGTVTASKDEYAGGVIGINGSADRTETDVKYAYYNTDMFFGNAYGENYDTEPSTSVTGLTTKKFTNGTLPEGFSSEVWVAGSMVNEKNAIVQKFPYLKGFDAVSQPLYELEDAIFIAEDGSFALVNGSAKESVNIENETKVTGPITFSRIFSDFSGKDDAYSTIMLPFVPTSKPAGATFFAFDGVSKKNGEWVVSAKEETGSIAANTPYLLRVDKESSSINFADGGVFKSTAGEHSVTKGQWKLIGTYEYKTWLKGDAGIGKTYGFAGLEGNESSIIGTFAKVGAGAYIYPMRAYLEYDKTAAARPAANDAPTSLDDLPEEMKVVIDEKNATAVVGTLNTRTGEFKSLNNRWYDLNGRYLGKQKPTQKGSFYNNGKKVIEK